MNHGKNNFKRLCFLSMVLILFTGPAWADQLYDLPTPRASQTVSYLEEETIPEYEGEPEQLDIAAEAEAMPQVEGVPGGVVVVRELPVADKASAIPVYSPKA